MEKKKSIRGYSLDIAVTIYKKRVELNIHPLCWNKPMLCVPRSDASLSQAWHLNLGPFHLWGMETDNLLAVEINFDYLHFWWDKPVCPSTMKRIF